MDKGGQAVIYRSYRFKLKTTPVLENILRIMAGHARFVWNKFLAMNLVRLRNGQKILWYDEMAWFLKLWKQSNEYGFLNEAQSQVLQQKLMDLAKAFKDAFGKKQPGKRLPRFKEKGRNQDSIRFPQGIKVSNRRVWLPKIGWVGFFKSRDIPGTIKSATISREADGWYISILVEAETPKLAKATGPDIGVDRGVAVFAATSEGELVEPLDFTRIQKKIAKLQRKLAKQKKRGKNWLKTKARIAKLQQHQARMRLDFLHKLSTGWSKKHLLVVLEDLKVGNMTRSAKGTVEEPGKNVTAKSGLNRSILAQGWGMFGEMLGYKLAQRGGHLLLVPPQYSSQTCSACGHVAKENRPSRGAFKCQTCGYIDHADVNAAKVILQRGLSQTA